jgi:hypothetical protein
LTFHDIRTRFGKPGVFGIWVFLLAGFIGYQQYDSAHEFQKCSADVDEERFEALIYEIHRSADQTLLAYLKLSKQMMGDQGLSTSAAAELQGNIDRLEKMGAQSDMIEKKLEQVRQGYSGVCDRFSNIALWDAFLSVIAAFLVGAVGFGAGVAQARKSGVKKKQVGK